MTTIALAAVSISVGNPALTGGILTGLIVSPDLDLDNGFIGFAHIRRVNRVVSLLWRGFWYPYAKVIKHRNYISHSIFFGTVARVAYMAIPLLILNYHGVEMQFPSWAGAWFVGLCLSDALHIILDNLQPKRTLI